jgi:hypothetical protein
MGVNIWYSNFSNVVMPAASGKLLDGETGFIVLVNIIRNLRTRDGTGNLSQQYRLLRRISFSIESQSVVVEHDNVVKR